MSTIFVQFFQEDKSMKLICKKTSLYFLLAQKEGTRETLCVRECFICPGLIYNCGDH